MYPRGSVGEAYQRAIRLREAERTAKGQTQTKEQEKRDDWPRAWKWLEPMFADLDPKTIPPEFFLSVDPTTGKPKGLVPKVEKVSVTERHRAVKVWRALWKKMATMGYCDADKDPSKIFANSAPQPRQALWTHHEVTRLVQRAWRENKPGLAAVIAVAWDTMLSPVDVRTLSKAQMRHVICPRTSEDRACRCWDAHALLSGYSRSLSGAARLRAYGHRPSLPYCWK
jgi:hypothetical protein